MVEGGRLTKTAAAREVGLMAVEALAHVDGIDFVQGAKESNGVVRNNFLRL